MSSNVPVRRSSAHSGMPSAGIRNMNSHGIQLKNGLSSACPSARMSLKTNVQTFAITRKITRKTQAAGEARLAKNSREATAKMRRIEAVMSVPPPS